MLSYLMAFVASVVTAIGFASAVVAFVPRLQIEVAETVDTRSPLPSFITIINGFLPLKNVSLYVRIYNATSTDGGGKIIGSRGAGGITTPAWKDHHLRTDEKWNVPMGSNVPFIFNVSAADILIVVTYWPWHLPKPSFIALREHTVRLVIHRQPDGRPIWIVQPVD